MTGLDTRLLDVLGSLGEITFGGTVFSSHLHAVRRPPFEQGSIPG